jgi:hypothetical protein
MLTNQGLKSIILALTDTPKAVSVFMEKFPVLVTAE